MFDDRHGPMLSRLAALAPDAAPLERICRGSLALLGVSGAAVILMSEEESGAVTASFGARVKEVEDLQFALGQGSCLEAFRMGRVVFEPDLPQVPADRWPVFARAERFLGARAVFVLPMQLGAIRVGVLYLYRESLGVLSAEQLADSFDLAGLAMLCVLEAQSHARPRELGIGLEGEWAHRAAVHQATGLVAAHLDTKLADALAVSA